jgi:transcriptional regulator of acetoin/glycerol metabolism
MGTGSTASSEGNEDEGLRELVPVLVQQHGGAPEDEGRRLLVDGALLLGRDNPLFAERYPKLSRRHAEISSKADRLRITDLGSRHGTFVGGRRVERAVLEPGQVVEAGDVRFVVTQGPRFFVPTPHPRFAFASYGFSAALDAIHAARSSRQPLVIVGEQGVGKSALADELLEDDAGTPPSSRAWDLSTPQSAFASPGGPLVVDRLDEATEPTQQALLASLREAERTSSSPRVVVLSCVSPAELARKGTLLPALSAYLSAWVVRVPPLRERPEDVLPIVRARLAAFAPASAWEIHPDLFARLARDPWPGNVRALLAETERLYLSATERQLVDLPEPTSSRWRAGSVCKVAADASWLEGPNGARIELGSKRVLRAVLLALVEAHVRRAELLTSRDLAKLAWPGERMLPRAAANRVYVAVTGLRKLGFGAAIENTGEGYRFAAASVEVVPAG